jgi:type I restriction-modification system DNA methylase subunit
MVTFAEAKREVAKLVAKYENLPTRTLNRYDEENTKKDFILPLFRHLGWEVDDLTEVAAEEKASSGRVDYAFKLGGVSRFYVEVKPLREDLGNRTDWAKQAITYAENKGVTWAILTNFKQLMVFNAEWDEPNLDRARFLNLTCHDYEPDFAKLWWLSKGSIEKGILNEEARKVGALKPKLPVEKSLYNQLLKWRTDLFNQIFHYQKDKGVSLRQTDELIQQFINRLVFIRNVEDRGIEENKLRAALHQWRSGGRQGDLIDRVRGIFRNFASVYDSDLFPPLDAWDSVFVESVTLERIIDGLYERPTRLAGYDFAAIDADVLGAVYEQYLGYVAQVAQEQAKREAAQARFLGFEEPVFELEAKRLKRKQQGIYYTPKFVVDYIVRETVGRFLKERNHNEIVNMKILDPACGSGSFLIRAYEELLNYHAYQKGKSPAELDQWERLPILTGNIFGVDLDRQAVEIARLNLLLRSLSRQETLPSLADNIRQGNSLISGTEDELRGYFGDNWQDKKPFNWQTEFKDIMANNGGFDVVISNPPYVGFHGFTEEKPYLKSVFQSAQGRFDLYLPFIEKGIQILKHGGLLGFICPTNFMKRQHGQGLRKFLQQNCKILKIVDFEHYPVFEKALNYTGIFIFEKSSPPGNHYIEYIPRQTDEKPILLKQANLDSQGWAVREERAQKVIDKINERTNPSLSKLVESISEGIVTGRNEIYLLTQEQANKLGLEVQLLKPAIRGKEIQRYFLPLPNNS